MISVFSAIDLPSRLKKEPAASGSIVPTELIPALNAAIWSKGKFAASPIEFIITFIVGMTSSAEILTSCNLSDKSLIADAVLAFNSTIPPPYLDNEPL